VQGFTSVNHQTDLVWALFVIDEAQGGVMAPDCSGGVLLGPVQSRLIRGLTDIKTLEQAPR
jgi:hypothetical protein